MKIALTECAAAKKSTNSLINLGIFKQQLLVLTLTVAHGLVERGTFRCEGIINSQHVFECDVLYFFCLIPLQVIYVAPLEPFDAAA